MGKVFERVVIVMLENTMRSTALANNYLSSLRKKGVFLSNAQGVTHPSQTNYVCMIAGDTMQIIDDDEHYVDWYWVPPVKDKNGKTIKRGYYNYDQAGYCKPTIVDLLEDQNLSWKCYAESLPEGYKEGLKYNMRSSPAANLKRVPDDHKQFPFARKHVPFLSFPSIVGNPDRLAKIVNADEFDEDLDNGKLPHFSYYVPNLINDGHSQSETFDRIVGDDIDLGPDTPNVDQIERFLSNFLGPEPVAKFPPETLVIVTFDEAYPYPFDFGIYTMLFGDFLEAGTTNSEPVNHYNLLRSVEDNFGLGTLKRKDAIARPYWFLRD
ncbi:MAG: alkaline phosphatase family protein [Bacteroidota bacterium]